MQVKAKQLEQNYGKPLPEILQEYMALHGNQLSVAAALGVSQPTVSKWLRKYGLQTTRRTVLIATPPNNPERN